MDLVSPHPFWLLKNGLPHEYPSLQEDVRCEVLVLGAGISGALIAHTLVKAGWNVVVVDKRDVAGGSTSASTALLQYEIDTHLVDLIRRMGKRDAQRAYRACHDSIDTIERLAGEVGAKCAFRRKDSAYLATKHSEIRLLQQECAARREAGIAVDFLDEKEIGARFSFSRPAALISSQAAELDAHRLTHVLLADAVTRGARVFDRTIVTHLEPGRRGVRLKTDTGQLIHATHVVMATGYESQAFLPQRIVRLKSTFALASEAVHRFPGWWKRCLLWETARPYLYLRTAAGGRILVGGEDVPFRNPTERDRLIQSKTARLATRFHRLFPEIPLRVDYRWAGTFGETKDGLAYIGCIRQMPRCHFALGFGGNGITYSAVAAAIIRQTLAGRRHPDAHLFGFDR
ncbi:FAD dependent oxidoreductase [Chthoniobacter flavus Ellin428]|uniref:FAD dependent oxidoreductase n=1 Tax=Chthoniobacter flavus Ellin428 TaxID=497964 RepID=B4D2S8_9BACT|nr:FAD-dependent oxidoreductase [Chthoniobacter flavus]EDY19039.1 FAD dependent oxidoreductase [Chthoniobacter flavus Ellin428]TCO86802.1 glycine/D-amino acid oxidase-like deaminating enzyme [Chthoniobacter flavus]